MGLETVTVEGILQFHKVPETTRATLSEIFI